MLQERFFAVLAWVQGSLLARRLISGASWSLLGAVIGNGLGLAASILIARMLAREAFGYFIALQTTVALVSAFAAFGVGIAATRFTAELSRRDPARLQRILALCELIVLAAAIAGTVILLLGSQWLALHAFAAPPLASRIGLVALATMPLALDGLQKSVLIGLSQLRGFAFATIAGALTGLPLMLGLTYACGLDGAVLGLLCNALAASAASRLQMRSALSGLAIRPTLAGSRAEFDTLARIALPGVLSGLLPVVSLWLVQAILIRSASPGELAIFGVAMQWFGIVNFVPTSLARALMPLLTDVVADQNHRRSGSVLLAGIAANSLTALPVAVVGALLSSWIVDSYGPQFAGGELPLMIAMGVAVVYAAQYPVQQLLAARAQMWRALLLSGANAGVFVGGAALLVGRGATGAALAFAAAYLVQAAIAAVYASRFLLLGRARRALRS